MTPFRIHTGETIRGPRLQKALDAVADAWADNARKLRAEDPYPDHVTEAQKDEALARKLESASVVRRGVIQSFTMWQRVNTELTGECVAFLPAA